MWQSLNIRWHDFVRNVDVCLILHSYTVKLWHLSLFAHILQSNSLTTCPPLTRSSQRQEMQPRIDLFGGCCLIQWYALIVVHADIGLDSRCHIYSVVQKSEASTSLHRLNQI